ncbi:MAG: MFS transporter [Rhodobacteraceae bacterium]|nr:MFS transporter [Paracoccaceae bacterium]
MSEAAAATGGVRQEFARGWPIIVVTAIGLGCGLSAIPIYTLGVFTKPLGEEFGWTRGEVQAMYTWMTIGNLVASPALGLLIDRHGTRLVCMLSLIGQAIGYLFIGLFAQSLFSLYALGFLTAVIGVGTVPISWTRVIVDWFDKARGQALGLALAGTGLAAVVLPVYTTWVLESFGWRAAYMALGALPAFLALPLSYFLLRDRTTGGTADAPSEAVARPPEVNIDFKQAITGYRFWAMNLAFFIIGVCVAGLIAHLIPMLTDRGIETGTAAQIAGAIGMAVIVGRIGTGYLIDRFWAPGVGLVVLCLPIISCVILASGASTVPVAVAAAVLIGLAAGAEFDLMSFLVSRYFGQRRYGLIYAALYAVFKLSAGIGGPLFGFSFDSSGSYVTILSFAMGGFATGAALLLCLGRYPKPQETVTAA